MQRIEDWQSALMLAIRDAYRKKFKWGEHDCALFCADVVKAITGQDFARRYRGTYHTEHGAREALASLGKRTLVKTVSHCLGEPIDAKLAQRGDVVLFKSQTGLAIAICLGDKAAAVARDGIIYVPMDLWRKAWRV